MTVSLKRLRIESGIALVAAVIATTVIAALAAAALLDVALDDSIAAGYRDRDEGRYVLEAVVQQAVADLAMISNWTLVLNGTVRGRLLDGAPSGRRRPWAIDGVNARDVVDLGQVVSLATCGRPSPCSNAETAQATAARPWGVNNPQWQLFSYGPEALLLTPPAAGRRYLAVLVGDDPAETDGDPLIDGAPGESGHDIVELQAHVFGARGLHLAVDVTVGRGTLPADYGSGVTQGVRVIRRKYTRGPD